MKAVKSAPAAPPKSRLPRPPRVAVPPEAVRSPEQILAGVTVQGGCVWEECYHCCGTGKYPSSLIPAGQCYLYCWKNRTPETFGKLPVPIEKYVKRAQASDRRNFRESRPEVVAHRAEVARIEAEARAACRAAELAERGATRETARAAFLAEHPGLEDDLRVDHPVVKDIAGKLADYGSLSEKQVALVQRLVAEARRPVSQHVGRVGERVVLTVTVDSITRCEGAWGASYRHIMTDTDGNVLKWFGSRCLRHNGEPVTVRATVKEHGEWQGVAQTTLLRVKLVSESHSY